jgi:hypothetical protein
MPNRQTRIRTAETATFGGEHSLVADEQHLDITFPYGLESPLNGRSRSMVTAHGIKRNFHRASYSLNDVVSGGHGKRRTAVTTLHAGGV